MNYDEIIYDKVIEIVKLTDINKVNEYLAKTKGFGWYTRLCYELIACIPETDKSGNSQIVYILGKKFKQVTWDEDGAAKKSEPLDTTL